MAAKKKKEMGTKKKCRILTAAAILTCVLGGCGSQTNPLAYEAQTESYPITAEALPMFADKLCVVPSSYKEKKADPVMTATSSLLFDVTDSKILYANHIYDKLYPASVTKLVTAYVALQYADLADEVTVGYEASHITEWGAKLCGFQEGDKINLRDLLYVFLIYSGNDAGIAIAEHISGSVESFAQLMNQEAKKLGAVDSHFVNPHGLHDDDHYTTTYDMYLVLNQLIHDETFLDIIHTGSFKAAYRDKKGKKHTLTVENTNRFINGRMEAPKSVTVIGGKTGTTMKAGSNLALYSQGSDGHDYISIVFQAKTGDDLFLQMKHLLEKIPG